MFHFFNPSFPLPWSSLLPFRIGFVATAPSKQWRSWKARLCGEGKLGEKALPGWQWTFSTLLSATCNAVRRFRVENALGLKGFLGEMMSLQQQVCTTKKSYGEENSKLDEMPTYSSCALNALAPKRPPLLRDEEKRLSPFTGEAMGPGDLPTASVVQTGIGTVATNLYERFLWIYAAALCGYAIRVRASWKVMAQQLVGLED